MIPLYRALLTMHLSLLKTFGCGQVSFGGTLVCIWVAFADEIVLRVDIVLLAAVAEVERLTDNAPVSLPIDGSHLAAVAPCLWVHISVVFWADLQILVRAARTNEPTVAGFLVLLAATCALQVERCTAATLLQLLVLFHYLEAYQTGEIATWWVYYTGFHWFSDYLDVFVCSLDYCLYLRFRPY